MKGKDPDRTVSVLIRTLRAPEPRWQVAAAKALARLGPKARPALEALTAAVQGANAEVKASVSEALTAIGEEKRSQ